MNSRAYSFFKAGRIQYVYYKVFDEQLLMKCTCYPEMKTIMYNIRTAFKKSSNVVFVAMLVLDQVALASIMEHFAILLNSVAIDQQLHCTLHQCRHCNNGISHETDLRVLIQLRALNSLKLSMEKMVNE